MDRFHFSVKRTSLFVDGINKNEMIVFKTFVFEKDHFKLKIDRFSIKRKYCRLVFPSLVQTKWVVPFEPSLFSENNGISFVLKKKRNEKNIRAPPK